MWQRNSRNANVANVASNLIHVYSYMCIKLLATFALFPVLSLWVRPHTIKVFLSPFYFWGFLASLPGLPQLQFLTASGEDLGTRLEGSYARKNTRLSLHAQVQFLVPEQRSLGTRLEGSHMRKNTRLSLHAQVQFLVPEQRSLGTRLEGSYVRKITRLSPHAQVQFLVPEQRSLGTRLESSHVRKKYQALSACTSSISRSGAEEPENEASKGRSEVESGH